jgi:hypothetical protein
MATVQRPEILLLSLAYQLFFDEMYSSLLESFRSSVQLRRAKTASGVMQYLATNSPKAIVVTDEGLTKAKNSAVLDRVVSYVRNGGLVIVGLHFTSFTQMDVFDKFFNEGLSLPWKHGDYHRTTFQLNSSSSLPTGVASNSFPAPYSMKVLHVKYAEPHEKIFVPITDAMTQSHVFSPEYVDQTQAAVVGTRLGDGYIAYVGDVNAEKGSDDVILRLCGL